MILKLGIAIFLGTLVSVIIGHLVVHRERYFKFLSSGESKGDWDKSFSDFIRSKIYDFGGHSVSKPMGPRRTSRSKPAAGKAKDVLGFFRSRREQLAKSGKGSSSEAQKLDEVLGVLENYTKRNISYFKNQARSLNTLTKGHIGAQALMGATADLVALKTFEVGESEKFAIDKKSVWNCIESLSFVRACIKDLSDPKRPLCKLLAQKKYVDEILMAKAIEASVLLKLGGSEKAILMKVANKKYKVGRSLKVVMPGKIDRAVLAFIRSGGYQYFSPKDILNLLLSTAKKIELKSEGQRQKEQSKKKTHSRGSSQRKSAGKASGRVDQYNSHCSVLGVQTDQEFSQIKKAYRKLVMLKHPDRLAAKGLSKQQMAQAHDEFLEIQNSYEYLESAHRKKKAA
jgi:hypothetical protein